jgi:HD-GYP domain-containing protein (c-di-GMP phosphodiesterase class II)/DNA-binding CsgD family transcriptional regulator
MIQSQLRGDDPPPGCLRTADLLGALSLAADLATGLPAGHAVRSCYIGMHIADLLQLSAENRAALYYAELLMDAGCTAWTSHLSAAIMGNEIDARRDLYFFTDQSSPVEVVNWLREYMAVGAPAHRRLQRSVAFALHGKDTMREAFRNTCEVAKRFAERLGMSGEVQTALLSVFEQWNGDGPNGARGDVVPITSRIVYATSFLEAFHRMGGRHAALHLAEQRRGKAFDPTVVDAFLSLAQDARFWEGLEGESVWRTVLAMEPQSSYRYLKEEKLEDVALAFADFADLKSFYAGGHSRRVGDIAERMARLMRLPPSEVVTIRLAGLLHDVGLVTVPSFALNKAHGQLTPVEWESIRLHPYHGERILSRVQALEPVVPLVAAHHERMDGTGYYRGLLKAQIPLGARIIGVADRFDDLTHEAPDHPAFESEEALTWIGDEAGVGLCTDCCGALVRDVRADGSAAPARKRAHSREWPAGLTGREVEILRLLAKGLSRRTVAQQLFLSEHTVRHHLEHIYTKIGVSTRVAATLFAMEHGLLH